MKDLMGTEIVVGSYVAYPGHVGSTTYMTAGLVVAVDGEKLKVKRVKTSRWGFSDDRLSTISNIRNVVVIPAPLSSAVVASIPDTNDVVGANPT